MSLLSLFSQASNNNGFYIYDNNYTQPELDENVNTPVMTFNSMLNFNAKYSADVAQEPIERGSYTTDSVQNKATIIKFTGIYSPNKNIYDIKDQNVKIQTLLKKLQQYKEGTELVTISMQNPPMFDIYTDLKIFEFDYEINSDKTSFVVDISAIVTRQNSADNGTLPLNQVSQNNYSSKIDNGQQTPQNINNTKYNFGN